jgi:NAD-dependent deacetylase
MTYEEKIRVLAEYLKKSGRSFAFSGAGVSTESGIPDFRSRGSGLWERVDPMKAASLSALRREPVQFYKFFMGVWESFVGAKPNAAHYALARLEQEKLLAGVITQNIDGLHRAAGSQEVWEVHGHMRSCRCLACSKLYPFDALLEQYRSGTNPPLCSHCGGMLRPDVVLFEDAMGEDFYKAYQALSGCQLLIVVGSSLQVYPAASLPELAKTLVIVNREPTPWNARAGLVINEKMAGQVFTDLMTVLGLDFGRRP